MQLQMRASATTDSSKRGDFVLRGLGQHDSAVSHSNLSEQAMRKCESPAATSPQALYREVSTVLENFLEIDAAGLSLRDVLTRRECAALHLRLFFCNLELWGSDVRQCNLNRAREVP